MAAQIRTLDVVRAIAGGMLLLCATGCYVHRQSEWTVYEGVANTGVQVRVKQLKLKLLDDIITYIEYRPVEGHGWKLCVSSSAEWGGCWWIDEKGTGKTETRTPLKQLSEEELAQLRLTTDNVSMGP